MLEFLDVAIGFATVMLAVSLIIMSLTQALSSLLALRGAKLRQGLEQLIRSTLPSVVSAIEKDAHDARTSLRRFTEDILQHPLISDSATRSQGRWSWATVIKKEELVPVLEAVLKGRKLPGLIQPEKDALEDWFESFMARVSQWFVMNTRWITVGLALVLSFAMHLDSVQVLKQLSEDTETRARVVSMSASLLDQAPQAVGSVEDRYTETLRELVRDNKPKFKDDTTEASVTRITKRSDATNWIEQNAKSPGDKNTLVESYGESVDKKLTEAIDRSIDRAKTLEGSLKSAGIALYPPNHSAKDWLEVGSSHFWGMVASVLFLSLGAPFWFNMLKNMTSLKSVVATREPAEKGAATGGGGQAPAVPATRQALPPIPGRPAQEPPAQ